MLNDRKACGNCTFFVQRRIAERTNGSGACLVEPGRKPTQDTRPACRHWQAIGWHKLEVE